MFFIAICRCRITSDGFLDIFHADESKPPTRVNLLTCQIKPADDKRSFDLISCMLIFYICTESRFITKALCKQSIYFAFECSISDNRPYHFQAEDENDQKSWIAVLINCKEKALTKTFQHTNPQISPSLIELQKTLIRYVENLPGNDHCCDCGSKNDVTWISLNLGVLVCIQCSGIHRDLGVHHSRIQSLTLDNITTANLLIARAMGNNQLNDVMEATIGTIKLDPDSSMDERYNFIRAKYVAKRYVMRTCSNESDLRNDLEQSIVNADLSQLLQVWAEGADLTCVLPSSRLGETALHLAVMREMGSTLHVVDFLIQNMPSTGLNKVTIVTNSSDLPGRNTALHLCALHDRKECMKLLLRSGADFELKNEQGKTALMITKEMGHDACRELIECAIRRQKGAFDHINTDWNLPHDDGSPEDSEDDGIAFDEKKSRSRPPSYAGGESPVLRSRSSTCDSIQSGSSPNAVSNQLQRQISNQYAQLGTSPKQPNLFPQQGRVSPGSVSNVSKNYAQNTNLSNRKSMSSTKMEKRTAPIPPYGTLPLAQRHSQSVDAKEMRNANKMQSDTYGTLPLRNSDAKQSLDLHFSNKIYEPLPFEAEIETPDKYDKHKYSQPQNEFTTFGHKRSLSGESIGRNLHLAGAKLVLPSGEIPVLKPVDKNVIRPKLPPPGPPPNLAATPSSNNGSYHNFILLYQHVKHKIDFSFLFPWNFDFPHQFTGRDINHRDMDCGNEYCVSNFKNFLNRTFQLTNVIFIINHIVGKELL